MLEVVVVVSNVVDEDVVVEVVEEEDDEDVDDEVVDVVDGGMQQLFESHLQSWLDTYRSLQSCASSHIIVVLEQLPPTVGHIEHGPYFP